MLDEPTAALGVAQTAEVLNLIERLREQGLGVILVSHNMADVQAVADRIVVLRLGRNTAEFKVEEATTQELVAAITGASDNVVAERSKRRGGTASDPQRLKSVDEAGPAVPIPADLTDERLIQSQGLSGWWTVFVNRLRGGDLGNIPVILGLVVISLFFYIQEPTFLSSFSLVSITRFAAPLGIISLGIVLVLLLGEIDLSVGSVSGLAAVVTTVQLVRHEQPLFVALLAGILTGVAIGRCTPCSTSRSACRAS